MAKKAFHTIEGGIDLEWKQKDDEVLLDELIALILAYMAENGMLDDLLGKYNDKE
ncbi:hypothetical protein [Ruminococcus albus]|uniref:hypothetical protein n=1 Tax=Ruminococcus albus TaxID=1264 RepID=UPI001480D10C|nr:hypothetical protein [Ruminococcus albus]